ncbi:MULTISPECIES: hypothetical protein [Arthrobacter]|uniref:Uncharacterized protein n=1 Tax=Arthrobacter terricola TaxID=2547396 RepID=A0A4R5KAD3_9MICC|nr:MULTISPECIES: hypothetical protein [Arthrobacter]MBT8162977.1 hypothetical protein [Arthrobacter sp. GN70]TDF91812.1 hypothetical protein E1809_20045 [Arthrobacter terricola]
MITSIESEPGFHITGDTQSKIDDELTTAVALAQEPALRQGRGILITRTGHGSYTVTPSPEVPCGETMERRG